MSSSRKVILVSEPDEEFRDLIEDSLMQANYEVITTGDTAGVRELLEEFPMLDLLLLSIDVQDPGAWKLLEGLKRDTSTIDVPVFGIADDVEPEEIARLRDLGVEGLLERSAPLEDFLYRVNSRLFPAGSDRRNSPRAIAQGRITYEAMSDRFEGLLFNISSTGLFIRTEFPLAPDTKIQLEFKLAGAPRTIRCTGVVARVVVTPATAGPGEVRGIGVRFTTISPADTAIIREYVERQLRI